MLPNEIMGIIGAAAGIGLALGSILCTVFSFKQLKTIMDTASKNMEFAERMRKERDDYQRRYNELLVRMDSMANTIATEMETRWDIQISDEISEDDAPEE